MSTSVVVIGAGVVGCATAYELAAAGFSPIVLEKGPRIAEGVTSRNSGVIHAGIYYPPKSLKAQSCIRGLHLLYEWCRSRGVPHRNTGKWIVGSEAERGDLEALHRNAELSGASGIEWGEPSRLARELPGVKAKIGLFSAKSGIVDQYEYSRSLMLAAEEQGALFVLNSAVLSVARQAGGDYLLETSRGEIQAEAVLNAAGLHADEVARLAGCDRYRIYPYRGDYFKFTSPVKYERLIYPVKKKGAAGLGVHLTLSLDGSYRLGPDVTRVESKEDFAPPADVDAKRRAFFNAASLYLEGLREEALQYDTCGIRPKLRAPGDTEDPDFVVSEDLPGWVNMIGIESPGLTAARDLAQRAVALLKK